jgi:hypothetical protein
MVSTSRKSKNLRPVRRDDVHFEAVAPQGVDDLPVETIDRS